MPYCKYDIKKVFYIKKGRKTKNVYAVSFFFPIVLLLGVQVEILNNMINSRTWAPRDFNDIQQFDSVPLDHCLQALEKKSLQWEHLRLKTYFLKIKNIWKDLKYFQVVLLLQPLWWRKPHCFPFRSEPSSYQQHRRCCICFQISVKKQSTALCKKERRALMFPGDFVPGGGRNCTVKAGLFGNQS